MANRSAEANYRAAWFSYLLSSNPEQRKACEFVMNSEQVRIGRCPADPDWVAFKDQLPGFNDFWGRIGADANAKINSRVK